VPFIRSLSVIHAKFRAPTRQLLSHGGGDTNAIHASLQSGSRENAAKDKRRISPKASERVCADARWLPRAKVVHPATQRELINGTISVFLGSLQ
jgi:hypothetical protein